MIPEGIASGKSLCIFPALAASCKCLSPCRAPCSHPLDPPSVKEARQVEEKHIARWIKEARARKQANGKVVTQVEARQGAAAAVVA